MDFEAHFQQPLKEMGIDLIEVEYKREGKRNVLRFYIDKKEGVGIDDCEATSRYVSDALDELDPIQESYYLEVTSLGLDRAMKKDQEFENSIGKDVVLKFYAAQDGEKEVMGNLKDFNADTFTLVIDGEDKTFQRSDVSTIRKYIQW